MTFNTLTDVNLSVFYNEDINHKVAIKHSLLFSKIDNVVHAILNGSWTIVVTDKSLERREENED